MTIYSTIMMNNAKKYKYFIIRLRYLLSKSISCLILKLKKMHDCNINCTNWIKKKNNKNLGQHKFWVTWKWCRITPHDHNILNSVAWWWQTNTNTHTSTECDRLLFLDMHHRQRCAKQNKIFFTLFKIMTTIYFCFVIILLCYFLWIWCNI